MSYAVSEPLQAAIYTALAGDAALAGIVGAAIYDQPPAGPLAGTWVSLGPERVRDASDDTTAGARHDVEISVLSDEAGFSQAKLAAGAVTDALVGASLALSRGHLVGIQFVSARAARSRSGQLRRIDLTFRAFVEDA